MKPHNKGPEVSVSPVSCARVSCPRSQIWKLITPIPRSKQRCDHDEPRNNGPEVFVSRHLEL